MEITHLVLKNTDIMLACTPNQVATLQAIDNRVYLHRLATGRVPNPQYIVNNRDEPYIEEIIDVMRRNGQWEECPPVSPWRPF